MSFFLIKYLRKIQLFFIVTAMPFYLGTTYDLPNKDIYNGGKVTTDMNLKEFEKSNSKCAVLFMDISNGEIIYIYNRPFIVENKYTPGSIAKPWSALLFMHYEKELFFDKTIKIDCSGKHYLTSGLKISTIDSETFNLPKDNQGHQYFRCSLRDGHGEINLHQAIVKSCNDFFLTAASKNPEKFYTLFQHTFSLSHGTDAVLLSPGEKPFVQKKELTSPFRYAASSIGEGGLITCSPLKAAQIYSAIFANGRIPIPFERPLPPSNLNRNFFFSSKNINFVYAALRDTVKEGTLKNLSGGDKVTILAGKSGTATIYGERYRTHGWNILHIGHNNKEYVLVSFVEKGSGSKEALRLSSILLENIADIIAEYEKVKV